ncbi:membrane protein [Flavimobilis marinus]|uniref:DoxX-like family protein n=1 Tax=Flavimobilis marinus TaxID=285351 RepID=A0A1I2F1D5_9MICO|nr:DoxX family protein [Flavimobilis marinus]GHG53350.1 membrane protein [Flavimobilis marinus]SFE99152.1 DoxX-like family protein [Flavimobilis marinus]
MSPTAAAPRRHVPWAVVVPFAISGVVHLARPQTFTGIIPTPLRRWDRSLVLVSGVAELACAAGLLVPGARRAAGLASSGLLLAVWPANVQMSVALGRRAWRRRDARSALTFGISVLRLPVQVPLVRSALRAR